MPKLTDLLVRIPSPEKVNGERIARKMIDLAYRDGIRALCCTVALPYTAGIDDLPLRQELYDYAREKYPTLTFVTSAELQLPKDADLGLLAATPPTVGRSDLLLVAVEEGIAPDALFRLLMRCKESGHGVLLSHPERTLCLQGQPTLALRLAELGILFQLTASAVLGEDGLVQKGFCREMLKKGAVFSIASDATDHLYRPPRLSKCYASLERRYGRELADRLLCHNPSALLGLSDQEKD